MNTDKKFYFNIAIAVAALGAMPFFKKIAIAEGMSAFALALTSAVAAAMAAVVLNRYFSERRFPLPGFSWALFDLALIGVLSSGLVVLMNAGALTVTTATNRAVFQAMYPIATTLFAWWILDERLRALHYLLIVIMSVGILLVNTEEGHVSFNLGFWLLLATLPIMGFCDVYAKRTMSALNPSDITAGRFVFGLLFLLMILPLTNLEALGAIKHGWYWAVLGGAATSLGIFAFYRAMAIKKAGLAAAMVSISPVVTVVLEGVFLEQLFAVWQLLGIMLVVIGAMILTLKL
ncbi:DMT family transporter [Nitrosococcus wardiae]|uniref:DMT family transporter n=1 Tax=Nitrosococcus wardiae TaxID=1814290 RepID=A0A4P7BXZ9_9GAMM|nr:DMT family transporter [Nitrosococcus wardiae]QBQ54010.1 DMT family transporter [Nitrosococcus wardiae]